MIDLHTHILPGMDDGARDSATSLELLRMEKAQGVDRVIFTPHFYREREDAASFLARRREAIARLEAAVERLSQEERAALPQWEVGAEVAWMPNLVDREELNELCLGKSRYFLLELPMAPWGDQLIHQLYDLMGQGRVTPVIAHLDRYWSAQRPEKISDLLRLGFPIQVSADVLLRTLSRGKALRMMQRGQVHLLASDCHSLHHRPPNLGSAMEVVARKLGQSQADRLCRWAEEVCAPADEAAAQ